MIWMIVNPTAGTGRGAKVGALLDGILTAKGVEHKTVYTERPGHATELADEAAKAGAESVISVGGDGTSYEVACGLVGKNAALGIIPAGTGNDFIKALGIPKKPKEALDWFLTHDPRDADCCMLNDRMFLNACGTGFDISVLDYAEKAKKHFKGLIPYLYGVIKTIHNFRSVELSVEADGKEYFNGEGLVVAVTNGQFYGGGIKISPEASPNDGLLDVVVMRPVGSKLKLYSYLPGLMSGKVLTFPETTHTKATEVIVRREGMRFNVDGEILKMDEARIRIIPNGIKIHY